MAVIRVVGTWPEHQGLREAKVPATYCRRPPTTAHDAQAQGMGANEAGELVRCLLGRRTISGQAEGQSAAEAVP